MSPSNRVVFGKKISHGNIRSQQVSIKNVTQDNAKNIACHEDFLSENSIPLDFDIFYGVKLTIWVIPNQLPTITSNFKNQFRDNSIIRKIDDSVDLECEVSGEPSIRSFTWYKDGDRLIKRDDGLVIIKYDEIFRISLKIKNLTAADAGNYSCVSMNLVGRDEHFVVVKIAGDSTNYND